MLVAHLSPAARAAYLALLTLPPEDLRRRPAIALAEILSTSPRAADYHLAQIAEQQLVRRIGRGVRPIRFRRGSIIHAHGEEEPCQCVVEASQTEDQGRHVDLPLRFATPGNHCVIHETIFRVSSSSEGRDIQEKFDRVRSLVHVYERKRKGGKRSTRRTEEGVDLLVEGYTARRRAFHPLYRPSVTDRNALRMLVKHLEFHDVTRSKWAAYLDYVFEKFPHTTRGRCYFPPVKVAAAGGWVDSYISTLGERRLDYSRVPAILARAGFEGVDADLVLTIARKVAGGERMPRGLDDRQEGAVRWLAARLADVGYRVEG